MSDTTATGPPQPQPDGPTATRADTAGAATPDAAPAAPPGYELHDLVGSGGMGLVYRAHDRALTRDVAVKFLHSRYAPDSVAAWRFTEEARITAGLQHPGIPPVHQVGRTPDGRPFLAMKLINGHTLEDLLKKRKSPAEDRGRFIGIFEQVCQAVAFAHSRRIIHRDLKPANVMVGDFAEVQVMDWGLAKQLGAAPSAEARQIDETLSIELRTGYDAAGATQAGSLLGTPAYMPPEQAVGAIDQITERSDVFGLGAILCVVLTGQPPFVAETSEAARVVAARGKLDDCFARLNACGAEPELIALAKWCLSPEAADRPVSARAVANDVELFRARAERRAREAETERATAEVKAAEERKRRRAQRALALAVLGLCVLAGVAAWRIDGERTRRRTDQQAEELRREAERRDRAAELRTRQLTTERDVTAALFEVQALREQGLEQTDDPAQWAITLGTSRSALKRAQGLLASGEPTDALRARVGAAGLELDRDDRDCALLTELDRICDENEIRLFIPIAFTGVTSRRYAAAFRAHGIDFAQQPTADAIAWVTAHRFRHRLGTAIRDWTFSIPPNEHYPALTFLHPGAFDALTALGGGPGATAVTGYRSLRTRLHNVLDEITRDPFLHQWWKALDEPNDEAIRKLLASPELRQRTSRELASLAEGLLETRPELLPEMLAVAYERFPGEFWVHMRLAVFDGNKEADSAKALLHLTAAVAARPRSAVALSALGMALHEKGPNPTGARLLNRAAELDPTSPWPHVFLGMIAADHNKWEQSRDAFKNAVRADPNIGYCMLHAVLFSSALGSDSGAPGAVVAQITAEAAAVNPEHCGSHDLRGELHYRTGNYPAALAAFRRAEATASAEYLRQQLMHDRFRKLEGYARWEGKIDAVLAGTLLPEPGEFIEIANYCAFFEHKYVRAVRFAERVPPAEPLTDQGWVDAARFAGWAVRAASGAGADAADLAPADRAALRKTALAWLRRSAKRAGDNLPSVRSHFARHPDLRPVRDPTELAKLPLEERADWEAFWAELGYELPAVAPPPREVRP